MTTNSKSSVKYFVAWELDGMGQWRHEKRAVSLDQARQFLANEGCAQAGDISNGRIFFGRSWKTPGVQGEIVIECKNAARLDELCRAAASPLPNPGDEFAAKYAATRGQTWPPPTDVELKEAEERENSAMQDAAWREKEAAYKL